MSKSEELLHSLSDAIESRRKAENIYAVASVRSLASQFKCAPRTINRVLQELCRRGQLTQDQVSNRYYVAEYKDARKAGHGQIQLGEPPSHVALANRLRHLIASGSLPAKKEIPTAKELNALYGCGHRTIAAALSILEHEQTIERYRRGYRVGSSLSTGAADRRSGIYLTGPRNLHSSSRLMMTSQDFHESDLIMGADRECQRLGIGRLRYYLSDDPFRSNDAPADHLVAGYLHIKDETFDGWRKFFVNRKKNIPTVIVETGDLTGAIIRCNSYRSGILGLAIGNEVAGTQVGLHLRSLGHSRIAFFSPVLPRTQWAESRLRGLRAAYQGRLSVVHHQLPQCFDAPEPDAFLHIAVELRRQMEKRGTVPSCVVDELCGPILYWRKWLLVDDKLRSVFSEALNDKSITAWVCSHGAVASLAMAFLQNAERNGERKIAVASFDNSRLSAMLDLTSYDFDYESVGSLAINGLLRPAILVPDKNGIVRTKGTLVQRGSTFPDHSTPAAAQGTTGAFVPAIL